MPSYGMSNNGDIKQFVGDISTRSGLKRDISYEITEDERTISQPQLANALTKQSFRQDANSGIRFDQNNQLILNSDMSFYANGGNAFKDNQRNQS